MPDELGKIIVTRLTTLPTEPRAGKSFVLVAELNREVDQTEQGVVVSVEKQRLVPDPSGFPITRPTGRFYFLPDSEPQPINIPAGSQRGVSQPILVRKDAAAEPDEFPVRFPESLLLTAYIGNLEDGFCSELALIQPHEEIRLLSDVAFFLPDDLTRGQKVPNVAERNAVGAATTKIRRGTPEFNALRKNTNTDIIFKDEEGTEADRMMTNKLGTKLDALAALVKAEWPGVKLRVTEAWDENNEHTENSTHYEARAADLTTSDQDGTKLGRLGRLAVNAGLDWVFFENNLHIHVSVSK